MIKKLLVIVAVILTIGVIGYTVKQQADIRETNKALAEIELALAANERQQMEAQNLMLIYQTKAEQLNQRANSTWFSENPGEWALFDANYSFRQAMTYYDKAKKEAEKLYHLQVEHQRLLKQKLELLGK